MYLVIECYGGLKYATICMNKDGTNLLFETKEEAEELAEYCQDPIIVEVG